MCSIAGFNWEDRELVLKMNKAMSHRGPDGTGDFVGGGVSLGHNRLAIIDTSEAASQPMQDSSGRYTIIYNGELYNFKELRGKLDYDFKTKSDTEVVLASFIAWGHDCVKHFNGMFAFAIHDKETGELYLARDHAGIKPLYYYQDESKFIFASEIKAILEAGIERKLDIDSFNLYMRLLYVPEPRTMFAGISKLPAAHYAAYKDGSLELTRYFEDKEAKQQNPAEKVLYNKLYNTLERQLISDKPLGVYLSGGLDSSSILAVMSKQRGNIDTFSVGFSLREGEEGDKFNADFLLARQTAEHFKTRHHELLMPVTDLIPKLEEAIYHLDEPISNPTIIPQMALARFAKTKVDVVLSGDGGDELFGGYERYRLSLLSSLYQKFVPESVRDYLGRRSPKLAKAGKGSLERLEQFMTQEKSVIGEILENPNEALVSKFFEGGLEAGDFETEFMRFDRATWLKDEALVRSDKMSMSAGLEVRVPLLDLEIFNFANSLPLKFKVGLFKTKKIMRETFKLLLPGALYKAPKRGWFSPGAKWLRYKEVTRAARDILDPEYYEPTKELFNWIELRRMLEDHVSGERYNLQPVWASLSFQIWAKRYKVEL